MSGHTKLTWDEKGRSQEKHLIGQWIITSKKFKALFFLLLFLSLTPLKTLAEDQGWINNSLSFTITSKLSIKFTQETRCNEITYVDPYLKNLQSGFVYKLPINFYFSLLYKRENTKKPAIALSENRYTLETGWKTKLYKKFDFDWRFRAEIRHYEKEFAENHLRFRFRFRIKTKLEIGSLQLIPFIATEPFADTIDNNINRNRFYLGVIFPLSKKAEFIINYIRQDTRNHDTVHILNSGFDLKF